MSKGQRGFGLVTELVGKEADVPSWKSRNIFYAPSFRCWNEQTEYEAHDVLNNFG